MTAPGTPQADDPLAGVDLFAGLAPAVRSRVAAAAVPRSYRRGQLLFLEKDPGDSLIMVRRGAVSVFRTAPTGDRALLYVVRPPGVLGELALLDGGSRSASAERWRRRTSSRSPAVRSWSSCAPSRRSSTG